MTAQWCETCKQEVPLLEERALQLSEEYNIELSYLVALFHNNQSTIPKPEVAEQYALATQIEHLPVLADIEGQLLNNVPYIGTPVPGKCLLSPRMEILACGVGDVESELLSVLAP